MPRNRATGGRIEMVDSAVMLWAGLRQRGPSFRTFYATFMVILLTSDCRKNWKEKIANICSNT
jgi:hypothetical protein